MLRYIFIWDGSIFASSVAFNSNLRRYTKELSASGFQYILAPNAVPPPRSNLGQQSYHDRGSPHALSGSVDLRGCSPTPGWSFTLRRKTDGAVCTLAGGLLRTGNTHSADVESTKRVRMYV